MATVLGIGVGLLILVIIWVISIFLCVALSRAQGGVANAAIGVVLAAVVLTIILALFPRGPIDDENDYIIYDYTYNYRTAIVSVCGIFLVFGLLLLVPFHLMEPRMASPLKTRRGVRS